MPGPVSDSYDPIWGTGANAAEVTDAIRDVRKTISSILDSPPKYILDVIREDDTLKNPHNSPREYHFSEKELRIIRFCLSVALGEEEI